MVGRQRLVSGCIGLGYLQAMRLRKGWASDAWRKQALHGIAALAIVTAGAAAIKLA